MPGVVLGFTLFFLCLSFSTTVSAFTFAHSPPTQCDPFTVSWTGGTPPFDILLIPEFDSPRQFTVSSFPDNGSFTLTLPLPVGKDFVVSMSDATGFASGGVTNLLTVGSSITQTSCSTDVPELSFNFVIPDQLVQCGQYNVTWDSTAVLPVTVTGVVPSGKSIQLKSNTTSDFYVWDPASVSRGTSIIFFVTDNDGRFGGSSHIMTVEDSADSSCINSDTPQSTGDSATSGPTAITSSVSSSTTSAPQATVTVSPSSGVSAAAIGGAVAGGLVASLIIGTLAIFFFRTYLPARRAASRYSQKFSPSGNPPLPPADAYNRHSSNPLTDFTSRPYGYPGSAPSNWTTFSSSHAALGSDYTVEPFPTSTSANEQYAQSTAALSQSALLSPAVPVHSNQRPSHTTKSSLDHPKNVPARFILHTDAEDETVELPPQYRERSQPPGHQGL